MPETTDGAERHPGCITGRLLGAVARMILIYPLVSVGSQLGQQAQRALETNSGAPYEGAIVGLIVGLAIGVSLWRKAMSEAGWRGHLADATLVVVCVVWLASLIIGATRPISAQDFVVPWSASLVGAAAIVALLRG